MRCRKAHWYLSARCDGTLSERQRLRLEAHLASCEECRREAFYFSEIASLATRMESRNTRPDFELRLKAAIRRAEADALRPMPWRTRVASFMLRPALVAAGVCVLGIGGLGAWSMLKNGSQPQAIRQEMPTSVSSEYGLVIQKGQLPAPSGELIPVIGVDDETRRLQARYLETGNWPRDYIMDVVDLSDTFPTATSPEYILQTVTPEQVTKKVSY